MDEDLPDWSLFDYVSFHAEHISELVGSQKDGAGKFAVGILAIAIAICFAPFALGWFILTHGFKVSTKTWIYAIVMAIIAIVYGVPALFNK